MFVNENVTAKAIVFQKKTDFCLLLTDFCHKDFKKTFAHKTEIK